MEEFKIDNLIKDFPFEKITFKSISLDNQQEVLKELDVDSIFLKIKKREYKFSFLYHQHRKLFSKIFSNYSNKEIIVFNLNFDYMYSIDIDIVIKYFDYIWYEGADDILFFDKSYLWTIYVSHYAEVSCIEINDKVL
jgi:hypothetical protein